MPFCWHPHGVCCVPKTPIPSPRFVLSITLSPSLRSCSRLLFPRGTPVTWKEKSLPSRRIAAKTPHRQIPDPTPAPVQKPALSSDRQHSAAMSLRRSASAKFVPAWIGNQGTSLCSRNLISIPVFLWPGAFQQEDQQHVGVLNPAANFPAPVVDGFSNTFNGPISVEGERLEGLVWKGKKTGLRCFLAPVQQA